MKLVAAALLAFTTLVSSVHAQDAAFEDPEFIGVVGSVDEATANPEVRSCKELSPRRSVGMLISLLDERALACTKVCLFVPRSKCLIQ